MDGKEGGRYLEARISPLFQIPTAFCHFLSFGAEEVRCGGDEGYSETAELKAWREGVSNSKILFSSRTCCNDSVERRDVRGRRNKELVSIESTGAFLCDLDGGNEGCDDTREFQGGRQGEGSVARAEKGVALSDGENGGAVSNYDGDMDARSVSE